MALGYVIKTAVTFTLLAFPLASTALSVLLAPWVVLGLPSASCYSVLFARATVTPKTVVAPVLAEVLVEVAVLCRLLP